MKFCQSCDNLLYLKIIDSKSEDSESGEGSASADASADAGMSIIHANLNIIVECVMKCITVMNRTVVYLKLTLIWITSKRIRL